MRLCAHPAPGYKAAPNVWPLPVTSLLLHACLVQSQILPPTQRATGVYQTKRKMVRVETESPSVHARLHPHRSRPADDLLAPYINLRRTPSPACGSGHTSSVRSTHRIFLVSPWSLGVQHPDPGSASGFIRPCIHLQHQVTVASQFLGHATPPSTHRTRSYHTDQATLSIQFLT